MCVHVRVERTYAIKADTKHKHEEEAVVSPAYTVAHPGAMVIEAIYTVVANRTMRRPWWPVDVARVAKLDLLLDVVDSDLLRRGRLLLAQRISVRQIGSARHDARIHECRNEQIHERKRDGINGNHLQCYGPLGIVLNKPRHDSTPEAEERQQRSGECNIERKSIWP